MVPEPTTQPFEDEPDARALYDRMLTVFRGATSVFYQSAGEWSSGQDASEPVSYSLWARKRPFGIRVEVHEGDRLKGLIVGNREQIWISWPGGRRQHPLEDLAAYEATRLTSFAKRPASLAQIKYWVPEAGTGVMPVLEPVTLWGLVDAVTHAVNAMRMLGVDHVDGEACSLLEVSAIGHTRHRYLWLGPMPFR